MKKAKIPNIEDLNELREKWEKGLDLIAKLQLADQTPYDFYVIMTNEEKTKFHLYRYFAITITHSHVKWEISADVRDGTLLDVVNRMNSNHRILF